MFVLKYAILRIGAFANDIGPMVRQWTMGSAITHLRGYLTGVHVELDEIRRYIVRQESVEQYAAARASRLAGRSSARGPAPETRTEGSPTTMEVDTEEVTNRQFLKLRLSKKFPFFVLWFEITLLVFVHNLAKFIFLSDFFNILHFLTKRTDYYLFRISITIKLTNTHVRLEIALTVSFLRFRNLKSKMFRASEILTFCYTKHFRFYIVILLALDLGSVGKAHLCRF